MTEDPYRYFRVEARDLLEQLHRGVLELERGTAPAAVVQGLLRVAHTLKSAGRVVRQREIADAAHAIEGELAPWRTEAGPLPPDRIERVVRHAETVASRLAALDPVETPDPSTRAAAPVSSVVRADVARIDAIVDTLTSAHSQLAAARRDVDELSRAHRLAEMVESQLVDRRGETEPAGHRARSRALAGELRSLVGSLDDRLTRRLDTTHRDLGEALHATEALRLLSAASVLDLLERVARDTARALGKVISVELRGAAVRLDAQVLALAQDALVQMVRNAVAHGIEAPTERAAAAKPAAGRVHIAIAQDGARLILSCRDDGRGVDVEGLRRIAMRRGLLSSDSHALGATDLLALLMRGGLSTSGSVTEVAGRGVGMDLVQNVARQLRGEIRIETQTAAGTLVELVAPRALAGLEVLVVESSGRRAGVALGAVRGTYRVPATHAEGSEIALGDAGLVPVAWLGALLGSAGGAWSATAGAVTVVLLGAGDRVAGIAVDRVLGTAEVIVRPVPALAPADLVVLGAGLDAGLVLLILDPAELVARARRAPPSPLAAPRVRPVVLVVDDSLTTRMLEKSILESAGFDVELAASGEEGLEKARRARYACFLVDVEMPGMDGFAFIASTRADPALRDVPSVLVTSRDAPEDRARGEAVGAKGYIVKGEFDQAALLGHLRRLVAAA